MGGNQKDALIAQINGILGKFQRLAQAVAAGCCHLGNPGADSVCCNLEKLLPLFQRHSRPLAGAAADTDTVHTSFNIIIQQALILGFVDGIVFRKGSRPNRNNTFRCVQIFHNDSPYRFMAIPGGLWMRLL